MRILAALFAGIGTVIIGYVTIFLIHYFALGRGIPGSVVAGPPYLRPLLPGNPLASVVLVTVVLAGVTVAYRIAR